MTPERIEKERSAFEAWHKETFGYLPKSIKTELLCPHQEQMRLIRKICLRAG